MCCINILQTFVLPYIALTTITLEYNIPVIDKHLHELRDSLDKSILSY